jgi:hypothetical protein
MTQRRLAATATALLLLGACASDSGDTAAPATTAATSTTVATPTTEDVAADTETTAPGASADDTFPSVIGAVATAEGDGAWRFDVTISSPYDSPSRYADAWRVLGPDGAELGIRILTHDHASEQPFTRSQNGIQIPSDVRTVTVEGRDLVNGWGGETFVLELPTDDS